MTTTNNTNYSVKALVAKYRNFVFENAPQKTGEIEEQVRAEGIFLPQSALDRRPDYQLIITLYNAVAGEDADKYVQQVMSKYADQYYKDALTAEEFDFLCNNFSEAIHELFENGIHANGNKANYSRLFSNPKRLQVLKEYCNPQQGATIYMCNSGCDIAELYPNCKVVGEINGSDDLNDPDVCYAAIGRIWLYNKNIVSQLGWYIYDFDDEDFWPFTRLSIPSTLNYAIYGSTSHNISLAVVEKLYNKLSPNGKIFVFTSYQDMAKHNEEMKSFRQRLVADKSIASIISFKEGWRSQIILLVIEKCQHEKVEIVSDYSDKSTVISSDSLDSDILWPGYYIAPKPKVGVSLSSIAYGKKLKNIDEYIYELFEADDNLSDENVDPVVLDNLFAGLPVVIDDSMVDRRKKELEFIKEVYPHMFVAIPSNLSSDYKDANICSQKLHVAGEPIFKKDPIVIIEQPCVIMAISSTEKKVIAGYIPSMPKEGICTGRPLSCLVPVQGVDVRYLCSIILSPSVSEQIRIVCDGVNDVISMITDKIIVPNHNEKERLQFLLEANYEAMLSSQKELKEEQDNFKKAVRMRKHALTQSLSAIQSSFNALNSFRIRNNGVISNDDRISRIRKTTVGETFDGISQKLKDMMPIMEHMADVEYSFGKTEWVDPEKFLSDYIDHRKKTWIDFEPIKDWTPEQNKVQNDIIDPQSKKVLYKKGDALHKIWFAPKALEKVLDNIVANAMAHGFTDANRNDYQLKFSWEKNDFSLLIKVENNGSPIPAGHDTASLLQYGVSSSLHHDGHNGIGCHEIDDIMQRYEGSVRIVSTPNEEFTVKYVLTFQSNLIQITNETI